MGLELLIVDEISPINSNFTNDSTGVEIVFLHAAEHRLFFANWSSLRYNGRF